MRQSSVINDENLYFYFNHCILKLIITTVEETRSAFQEDVILVHFLMSPTLPAVVFLVCSWEHLISHQIHQSR